MDDLRLIEPLCEHPYVFNRKAHLNKDENVGDNVASGRYYQKEDFTVVIQPFIKLFNAPLERSRRYEQVIDISYVTYDCFHFSQKGHAMAANLLWNNMLEPVGNKTSAPVSHVMERFYCPTEEAPYFFTYNNSVRFLETGRQD